MQKVGGSFLDHPVLREIFQAKNPDILQSTISAYDVYNSQRSVRNGRCTFSDSGDPPNVPLGAKALLPGDHPRRETVGTDRQRLQPKTDICV